MKLYVFKICPFVEKVKILLQSKRIACDLINVNIRSKPEWFLQLSPEATVPLLEVQDSTGTTLFINESNIICDYLDEISGPSLYPSDLAIKAHNKLWIARSEKTIFAAYYMTHAKSDEEYYEKKIEVDKRLSALENVIGNVPFFNGEYLSMIDIAYAPLFFRFECLSRLHNIQILEGYPKLSVWASNILSRSEVKAGFVETFDQEFNELLHLKESFLSKRNPSAKVFF